MARLPGSSGKKVAETNVSHDARTRRITPPAQLDQCAKPTVMIHCFRLSRDDLQQTGQIMSQYLRYGKDSDCGFDVPSETLVADCTAVPGQVLEDPSARVSACLAEPLGFPPLARCHSAGRPRRDFRRSEYAAGIRDHLRSGSHAPGRQRQSVRYCGAPDARGRSAFRVAGQNGS